MGDISTASYHQKLEGLIVLRYSKIYIGNEFELTPFGSIWSEILSSESNSIKIENLLYSSVSI